MYGLPVDFKTGFFCGRTLDLVCFTKYQVYLHLSDECLISVEGELSLDGGERQRVPIILPAIYRLIDQKITAASSTIAGTLSIVFEKGQTLYIYDSSKQFESYSISERGTLLIRV
jgi:hypothetical protein